MSSNLFENLLGREREGKKSAEEDHESFSSTPSDADSSWTVQTKPARRLAPQVTVSRQHLLNADSPRNIERSPQEKDKDKERDMHTTKKKGTPFLLHIITIIVRKHK